MRRTGHKGSSNKDDVLQSTPKTTGRGHRRTNTEVLNFALDVLFDLIYSYKLRNVNPFFVSQNIILGTQCHNISSLIRVKYP
jgi:hypothetical protein